MLQKEQGVRHSPLQQKPSVWEGRGQSVIAVPRGGSGQLHPGGEVGNRGWWVGGVPGFGEVMVACRGFQQEELGCEFWFLPFLWVVKCTQHTT